MPRLAALLIDEGFTPEDMPHWFPTNDFRSGGHIKALGTARRLGWTRADFATIRANLGAVREAREGYRHVSAADIDPWTTLPPGTAITASRAGLTPAEARSLLRAGEYDEPALRVLTALQGAPASAEVR